MLIEITSDVYDIANRIKYIDRNYYIVYNTERNNFEIHCHGQTDGSYCLTLPYNSLDERSLNYVYKTESKNIDKILEEIKNDNAILESAEYDSTLSNLADNLNEELR